MAAKVGISVKKFASAIRGGRMVCGFYQGNREAHRFTLSNA